MLVRMGASALLCNKAVSTHKFVWACVILGAVLQRHDPFGMRLPSTCYVGGFFALLGCVGQAAAAWVVKTVRVLLWESR